MSCHLYNSHSILHKTFTMRNIGNETEEEIEKFMNEIQFCYSFSPKLTNLESFHCTPILQKGVRSDQFTVQYIP